MAHSSHTAWLRQGVIGWNRRRAERHFVPSLKNANLNGADLANANLRGARLTGAKLVGADLSNANLVGADLSGANLSGANLSGADLTSAVAGNANFRGADLRLADVGGVDFQGANLSDADMRGVFFLTANFSRAIMRGVNVRSSGSEFRGFADLSLVRGLSRAQLAAINGDTGVDLPGNLSHPETWPIFHKESEDSPKNDGEIEDGFVFISYASADRDRIKPLLELLREAKIPLWWDQNIKAGQEWRTTIDTKLNRAAAVLTLWTATSTSSRAVVEEAAQAQSKRKLVHAKLDNIPLPYGFSETQYADLRNWDGSIDQPEFRKLIQGLQDRLNPPSIERIHERLVSSAPVAAVVEGGLVTAKDTPPNAEPPIRNLVDLENRLRAQETLAEKLLSAFNALDNNIGEAIRFDLSHFIDQIKKRPSSWYILSNGVDDIRTYLDLGDEVSWPGSTRNGIENLCKGHEALRPFLQPLQPSLHSPDAALLPPEINPKKVTDHALNEIVEIAGNVFAGESSGEVFDEPAVRTGGYLTAEVADAHAMPVYNDTTEEQKSRRIRKGLIALGGFVGTAVASITYGVTGNLLTSPGAAQTLLATLKSLLDELLSLF